MEKEKPQEQMEEQGFIKGEIMFTIFENVEEHFTIAKIKIHDTNEAYSDKEIVGKGYFSNLQQGVVYLFYGKLDNHPKFGLQYQIDAYKTFVPETKEAVISYLSSDLFYGIGQKTARSIVQKLGNNAVEKILKDPSVLQQIPYLKKKTIQSLVKTLQENQGFEQIAVQLTRYGIGLKMAQVLYQTYREETIRYIKENPYQFVFDIEGFGFLTADKIAEMNGISKSDPNRIQASCLYALQLSVLEGHVFLPLQECIQSIYKIVNINSLKKADIVNHLKDLTTRKKIILKDGYVYLPSLYYAEDQFSSHVKRIMEKKVQTEITDAELMKLIGDIEEEEIISYGEEQFTAIKQALHSKLMILTGGPGTGKTTVIKGILKVYAHIHRLSLNYHDYEKKSEYPFILTAPTGRAAKRLQESTGIKATTIHRLLGWDGQNNFEKNEYEKLAGKYIIVDEFSMVDTWLANHLFKAIPDEMQVLLVGDEDQLPSVGPGQVLSDLYNSDLVPYVKLTEVYRQKEGSKIIQLAHHIKNDTLTLEELKNDKDFSYFSCQEHQIIDVITQIFLKAEKKIGR